MFLYIDKIHEREIKTILTEFDPSNGFSFFSFSCGTIFNISSIFFFIVTWCTFYSLQLELIDVMH